MPATLEGQLVVAISSRALFDFEEENRLFESGDTRGYMQAQLDRLEQPASPGVAFSLVKKLLAFNSDGQRRVEVVVLSRNDPVSGMRVFRSAAAHGLSLIERGVFTQGSDPFRYLRPLGAHLFLSANAADVNEALAMGFPAAQVATQSAQASIAHPQEVRIAFDGDAVLFSDEAERVFQSSGLDAFQAHEVEKALLPLPPGPFKPFLSALHRLQQSGAPSMRIRPVGGWPLSRPHHQVNRNVLRLILDPSLRLSGATLWAPCVITYRRDHAAVRLQKFGLVAGVVPNRDRRPEQDRRRVVDGARVRLDLHARARRQNIAGREAIRLRTDHAQQRPTGQVLRD